MKTWTNPITLSKKGWNIDRFGYSLKGARDKVKYLRSKGWKARVVRGSGGTYSIAKKK